MRRAMILAVVLVLSACDSPTEPAEECPPGTREVYRLGAETPYCLAP